MNRQEIFDTVIQHLHQQGERSVSSIFCAYRGENGMKCSIGILIPDDLYTSDMEGNSVTQPIILNSLHYLFQDQLITEQDLRFFMLLQAAHDNWISNTKLKNYLQYTAKIYGLNTKVLELFS